MAKVKSDGTGKKTAIVIGAGVGGLATAARLQKAGFQVTLLEKNEHTGGRCSLIQKDGYRFDQGPSLYLMPRLFDECFEDLGTSLHDEGIILKKCENNYNVWFHDGECMQLSSDLARMKQEVERYEGEAGFERYLAFLASGKARYDISNDLVLHQNFGSYFDMLSPGLLYSLKALNPFQSIYTNASKFFRTERLRRAFTFACMYLGMSPFDAPATYSLLQYTELVEGIWYPEGGFWQVCNALHKVGSRLGVEYRPSTPVSRVRLSPDSQKATGVALESGETLSADIVVCNADLVYAYNNLLPPSSYAKSLSGRTASCSSISFYWALDRQIPELNAHNIFLAEKYQDSFDAIFKEHRLPDEPSFYVNVPSRIDPSAAPPGKDTIVVLCPVGHLTGAKAGADGTNKIDAQTQEHWDRIVSTARSQILSTIQARLQVSLEPFIVSETINTPPTWRQRFNLDKGAILGLSHSFLNVLCFRPTTRHRSISGLYFVGASTHPGTGVPIVLAGSKVVSEQILQDYSLPSPWVPYTVQGPAKAGHERKSDLDSVKVDPMQSDELLTRLLFTYIVSVPLLYGILLYEGVGRVRFSTAYQFLLERPGPLMILTGVFILIAVVCSLAKRLPGHRS